MSKRKIKKVSVGVNQEAEEFMALLLASLKSKHKCRWSDYFRRMADRLMKDYGVEDEEGV